MSKENYQLVWELAVELVCLPLPIAWSSPYAPYDSKCARSPDPANASFTNSLASCISCIASTILSPATKVALSNYSIVSFMVLGGFAI